MGLLRRLFGAEPKSRSQVSPAAGFVDVVGESFYENAFEMLRQDFEAEAGDEIDVEAWLVNEYDNPYGDEGRAVAVQINGHIVGYVARHQSPHVFVYLEQNNGRLKVDATIYFGDMIDGTVMNSVNVDVELQ